MVTGAAVIVLLLLVVVKFNTPTSPVAAPATRPSASPGGAGSVDIASMSPRERATRLFDRVLGAAESGDTAEMLQFAPMAIQSFQMLGGLDSDARYDLGMILAVTSNVTGALAQADSIEQAVPNNLLAIVLRAKVAEVTSDSDALERSYRRFLTAYDEEISTDRSEYRTHRRTIDTFRENARAGVGGS
jgi:hypothetical protein